MPTYSHRSFTNHTTPTTMIIQIQEQRSEWGFVITDNAGHRLDWAEMPIDPRDDALMMLLGTYNALNEHLTDPVTRQRRPTADE